jgi:predicted ATP-grasp superfamily ATP-dependent carboligase
MRDRVLVTDAEQRSVLAALRGLKEAGYEVSAVAGRRPAAGHWTRACSERIFAPNAQADPEGFVGAVTQRVGTGGYSVLLPGAEASLLALSERRAAVEEFVRLGLPPHEAVRRSTDKILLLAEGAAAGLPPPETVVCDNAEEARAAANQTGYPAVLKPARSFFCSDGTMTQRTAVLVNDEDALAQAARQVGRPFIVQRYQAGAPIFSVSGVVTEDRLLGLTTSRGYRTWPPRAGTITYAETVAAPAGLVDRILQLISALGWVGIFQIDLLELAEGRLELIDFNSRLFASLPLDIKAGANLPAIWCDWLLGKQVVPVVARPGITYRWEEGELLHLLWLLRRGELHAAARLLRPRRQVARAHFRLTDPVTMAPGIINRVVRLARRSGG